MFSIPSAAVTAIMSIDWLPFILQTSDPLFPTGAYAHSFGLEEFVRLTGSTSERDLDRFLTLQIIPALTQQELPYFRFLHTASRDIASVVELDHEINAWKIPAELRTASLRLGSRRLDILLKTAPTELLTAIAARISKREMLGHHLTISALQYATVPLEAALTTFYYQTLSGYCVAALKLLRIGQEACQRILSAGLALAQNAINDSLTIPREEAGIFNPLIEIASMRHAYAFERLFIS
jgi:urease accessory protein